MLHHQKKSELQIGKESRGISSDYRRPPPLLNFSSNANANANANANDPAGPWHDETLVLSTTPHKRVNLHQGAVMHPEHRHAEVATRPGGFARAPSLLSRCPTIKGRIDSFASLGDATATAILHHRVLGGRRFKSLQVLLPPFVVVSVPCFWWYLKVLRAEKRLADSQSDSDTIVVVGLWFDFFAALVFVTAVVISLKIAFPRLALALPWSLRQSWGSFAVAWSKPLAALLSDDKEKRRNKSFSRAFSRPTVTWTIGSKPKVERSLSKVSTEGVQVYKNGDVYEGEFHQGKCSGSGVYYYYMSGRYEGDWVDGKYDGYGVETWAKGSRYRGQYRQGMRHGYGVYRFYTGDVYTGEWSNGQSHGYGVHTCEDGSRYVGEFKWGVKHGLYHFRCSHYRRRCQIRAPSCNEVFDCRNCHNEAKNSMDVHPHDRHNVLRHEVRKVICSHCRTEQDVQQTCVTCGVCMGKYFCEKCNFFDDEDSKQQYHCDRCGICRTGGNDNFFHCYKCGCCHSIRLKDCHPCVEKAMHHNCPVCFEICLSSVLQICL